MTPSATPPGPAPRLESLTPITPAGADLDKAIDFYVTELGFAVRYREAGMAFVTRDDVELMLQTSDDTHWASQTAYRVRTTGVKAFYDELVARRSPAIHPNGHLAVKPWGATEFATIDPAGVCITFFEFPE